MKLRDKVMVITGASSGIGAVLAQECSRRGARVVLAARSVDRLKEIQDQIVHSGGEALAIPTDVTQTAHIQRLVQGTLDRFGRIDILVNNAGYGLWGNFSELPVEEIRRNFETNLFAAVACMQAVVPQFRKQGGGLIVNVESIVGLRAMPLSSCYSATKHALHAFSESLRVELADEKIRVLSVCPGLISTEFNNNRIKVGTKAETGPKFLYMPVEKCVARIVRAMERGRGQVVITGHARFIAMAQRVAPRWMDKVFASNYRRMLRKMEKAQ